jgi:hypothetical protein
MTVFGFSGGVTSAELLSIGESVIFGDMAKIPALLLWGQPRPGGKGSGTLPKWAPT